MNKKIKTEIMKWLKNIAYNYNHNINTNILSQMINMAEELGLNVDKIINNYQWAHIGNKVTAKQLYDELIHPINYKGDIVYENSNIFRTREIDDFLKKQEKFINSLDKDEIQQYISINKNGEIEYNIDFYDLSDALSDRYDDITINIIHDKIEEILIKRLKKLGIIK